jgi:hypothetical protein
MNVVLRPTVSRPVSWCQAPIWSPRPDFCYCQTVAGLLIWGTLADERTGLPFTIVAVLVSAFILSSESRGTLDNILLFQIRDSPTWTAMSPYLYPPGTGWPSCTPRHCVPFSSTPTTLSTTVGVLEPASTWGKTED